MCAIHPGQVSHVDQLAADIANDEMLDLVEVLAVDSGL
jgi:hypothetical protein